MRAEQEEDSDSGSESAVSNSDSGRGPSGDEGNGGANAQRNSLQHNKSKSGMHYTVNSIIQCTERVG